MVAFIIRVCAARPATASNAFDAVTVVGEFVTLDHDSEMMPLIYEVEVRVSRSKLARQVAPLATIYM